MKKKSLKKKTKKSAANQKQLAQLLKKFETLSNKKRGSVSKKKLDKLLEEILLFQDTPLFQKAIPVYATRSHTCIPSTCTSSHLGTMLAYCC